MCHFVPLLVDLTFQLRPLDVQGPKKKHRQILLSLPPTKAVRGTMRSKTLGVDQASQGSKALPALQVGFLWIDFRH